MPGPSNLSRSIAARPEARRTTNARDPLAAIVSHIEKRCATLDQRGLRVFSLNAGLHFRLAARPQCSMEVQPCLSHGDPAIRLLRR